MSQNPDEIRARIERTRENLSSDVNALAEEVKPSTVFRRKTEGVRRPVVRAKERVFGTASDGASKARETTAGTLTDVKDAATQAPDRVVQGTQGSPLAAGLIAFGSGLLVAALLPPTQRERQAAERVKEQAAPLVEQAKQVASESVENLKEPAKQAVESVKESASGAASTVKDESRSAAAGVTEEARA